MNSQARKPVFRFLTSSLFLLSPLLVQTAFSAKTLIPLMSYHRGELRNNANNTIGSRFVAASDQTITHLGFYDHNADGLERSHQVALFDLETNLAIASAEVPAGADTPFSYSCRWVELPQSTAIKSGKSYAIAAEVFADSDAFLNSSPDSPPTHFSSSIATPTQPVVASWGPPSDILAIPANSLGDPHANRSYLAGNLAASGTIDTQTITLQPETSHQTIHGFGASDAWNLDFVAKYWSDSERQAIARLLFTKEVDESGSPLGIGLSSWRFNIGAGSANQGDTSQIDNETRRVEGFLQEDGTYDWEQQSGQRWFLQQATDYAVEETVAFVVSPPIQFTKNGLAHLSEGQVRITNLRDDAYDDYAQFLAEILQHFKGIGQEFDYLSPVNEPQYNWNSTKQEGSYWSPENIAKVTREIDTAIVNRNVSTKQFIEESGQYEYLITNNSQVGSIERFFSPESSEYIGNLPTVAPTFAAHSYWTYYTHQQLLTTRENVRDEAEKWNVNVRQTEYSLLGLDSIQDDFPHTYNDIALFLAKVIQADLTKANVNSWSFWTAAEQVFGNHKSRFGLVRLIPETGSTSLRNGGTHEAHKTLWSFGNFSRFIRPGYQRIELKNADDLERIFGSAYQSPNKLKTVLVLINLAFSENRIQVPSTDTAAIYRTDREHNLSKLQDTSLAEGITLPARSITTAVIDHSRWHAWVKEHLAGYDPSQTTYYADPDADKASNLLEFATGTNPTVSTSSPQSSLFATQANTQNWILNLSPRASELTLEIQGSDDLETWSDPSIKLSKEQHGWTLPPSTLSIVEQHTGTNSDTLKIEIGPSEHTFYRLKVTSPN